MIIDFSDFSDSSDLTLNGDAALVNNVLSLTPDELRNRGSAFVSEALAIDADTSFQTQFQFRVNGEQSSGGADGLAFMLQSNDAAPNALGFWGGGLGYGGMDSSLVVEFDTYLNPWDPNDNHLAVLRDGDFKNALVFETPFIDLNSGSLLNAWIDYDGATDRLDVFLSENMTKPDTPLVSHTIQLDSLLGSRAFVGFSASTGGFSNAHELHNWAFASSTDDEEPNPNPGTLGLSEKLISVNEDSGEARLIVVRTDGSDGTVSVDYSINDGTATAGDDFTAASGTLTFAPGETSKEIEVPILDDKISETDETFSIAIGNAVGAVLGGTRTAIITIVDNDTTELSTLAFSQAEYNLGEEQGEASIAVIRTGNSNEKVSVDYATGDDYARAGSDYTAVSGTLTFGRGEMSKTFTVPLLDDKLSELNEALTLTLSNPVGIDLGVQNTARLIVEDDDESPFIFEREVVVSGLAEGNSEMKRLSGPTAFDWTPDGKMLIAKLDGIVRVFDNGKLLEQPFIDISEQVNTGGQRGLLGLAVHPEFPENPYVYLAFSYDPPDVEQDLDKVGRVTRLIRVAADPNSNYTTALPGSEVILLETPPVRNFHAAGAIRFGSDGSLFFSHGDGFQVSSSPTSKQAELLQSIDNPFGKLFRIDPITGEGYSDNPFYDGDPTSIQSKVYNYGLRNPWRYTLHPDTGEPFIGDVGWTNWEEINTGRGVNFGWPLYEGGNGISLRTEALADDPEFQDLYDSASEVTAPIYALRHSDGARSITMGDFYTGTTYPELYQGALFFTDNFFGLNAAVNALLFDEQGNVDSAIPFTEEPAITQISMGPDSNLYFSSLFKGEIGRWVFNG